MTFRAKPVVRRFQRPSWDTRNRRNFYLNLGFGLAVVAAVVILGIAVAISYYNDHLATVGSVDGQSITKDDLRDRTAIETWRLQIAQRRVNTQAAAGQLTQAQAELQTQQVDQARQQVIPNSLEKIIDNRIQAKLATDEAELALIQAVAGVSPRISAALEAREFDAALAAAAELRAPVDRFFDEVLVMAEDAQVRANRLRLLLDVRDTVGALGDLAQIPR